MAAYFSVLEPGDPILGHEARPGRPSDPRHEAQLQRQAVRGPRVRRPRGHRADRLRRARAAQAADVRPKIIVAGASAYPRIIDFERMAAIAHGVGALLFVDMAHIAGLVAAGRPSEPVPPRRHRHDHDPQDPPRAARRADLQPHATSAGGGSTGADFPTVKGTLAAAIDKTVFPGVQGGPLMHVIAGKAVGASSSPLGDEFRRDQRPDRRERRRPRRDAQRRRAPGSSPAGPTTT